MKMASTTSTQLSWVEKIDFDVHQANLAVETNDFTYFHVSRDIELLTAKSGTSLA